MTFPCKWGCGTLLDIDPSITTVTGRRIPLSGGIPHDCHLSPHHKGINSRVKAKAVAKSAIQRIDDFHLIDQAKAEIAHINNRLVNCKLVLSVEQKQTQLTAVRGGALGMSYQYHTDLKAKATSKSSVISIKIDPKYADAVPQMTSKEYEDLDKQRELQDRIKRKVKTLSKREKKRKKQKEDFDGYRYGEDF